MDNGPQDDLDQSFMEAFMRRMRAMASQPVDASAEDFMKDFAATASPQDAAIMGNFMKNITAIASPQEAPLCSEQHGVFIPQQKYGKGAGRSSPDNMGLFLFIREDGSFTPVTAALQENYAGLVCREITVMEEARFTIMIRFEWRGYPPKEFQLRTFDWCTPPNKINLSKLATEVAKTVKRFIEAMQGEDIAPEFSMWKVGPDGIQVEDLHLAALEQVSAGSWQARLFCKPVN